MSYDSIVLGESSLVHFWKLGEAVGAGTVADSKGSLTGTVNGTITFGQASSNIFAADSDTVPLFDGTTGYISFGAYFGGDAAWTYEFICKPTDDTVTLRIVLQNGSQSTFDSFRVTRGGSGASPADSIQDNRSLTGHANDSPLNTAIHVCVTHASTSNILYVNGSATQTVSALADPPTGTTKAWIGAQANTSNVVSTTTLFKGYLAKVAYYNAQLTPTQVTNHYNALTGGGGASGPPLRSLLGVGLCERVRESLKRRFVSLPSGIWAPEGYRPGRRVLAVA